MTEWKCMLCEKDCRPEGEREDAYGWMSPSMHWFGEQPFSRGCTIMPKARHPHPDEVCFDCRKPIVHGHGFWLFCFDGQNGESGGEAAHHFEPVHQGCFMRTVGLSTSPPPSDTESKMIATLEDET